MQEFYKNGLFIDNRYTRIYFSVISGYRTSVGERHHIIPRSLGGSNNNDNIVTVSPRVHFVLHKLLCRMVIDEQNKRSMYFALFQMMNRKICKFSSRDYESARLRVKQQMVDNNPMHDPEVAAKARRKRPEQSNVATKRNNEYWEKRARPIRKFGCPVCNTPITTRVPTKTTCSKSCSAVLQHRNK